MRCRLCETRAAAVTCVFVIALVSEASAGPLRAGLGLDLLGRFHNSAFHEPISRNSSIGATAAVEVVALEDEAAG